MTRATIIIKDTNFRITIPEEVRIAEGIRMDDIIEIDVKKIKNGSEAKKIEECLRNLERCRIRLWAKPTEMEKFKKCIDSIRDNIKNIRNNPIKINEYVTEIETAMLELAKIIPEELEECLGHLSELDYELQNLKRAPTPPKIKLKLGARH